MALVLTDATANHNDLTNVNTVADITTALPFAGGNTDAAGFTAASSQYFSMVDSASLKPTGNFTLEAWFKSSTLALQRVICSYSQNTAVAGIEIYVSATGKLTIISGKNTGSTAGTDYQTAVGATTVADGTWHHLAGVYDGSNLIVYVDGVQDGITAWTINPAYAATNYPRIGVETAPSFSGYADGQLDEVRLWNVAITVTQIANNKSVQLLGTESGLQAYYPFNSLTASAGGTFKALTGVGL